MEQAYNNPLIIVCQWIFLIYFILNGFLCCIFLINMVKSKLKRGDNVKSLGNRIKEARKNAGLKQSDIAQLLNIKNTTVSNWEKDISKPDIDTIEYLCGLFNVSANYFIADMASKEVLSFSEKEHIEKYRSLDSLDKKAVDGLLDTLSEREKPIIKEQSQDTEQSKEFIVLEPPKIIPCYPKLASAGTGEYVFNDIPMDMIETDNYDADFALGVNGKSMEPSFSDSDYVLVKKQNTVNLNDIAIYIVDGECLIKQFKGDHLHSLNPKYNDIWFNENQYIKCVGKVLGKA